jgi:type VI secretion system protein ImpA
LFERTRDLRVALLWMRAGVHLDGFKAAPQGLRLVHGLLANFWDTLHPQLDPDDGDPYARLNVLGVLPRADGFVGDLRLSTLVHVRGVGDVSVRAVEVALGLMPAKDNEPALTRAQLSQILGAASASDPAWAETPKAALDHTRALLSLLNERVGIERSVDLKPLYTLLGTVASVMPQAGPAPEPAPTGADEPAIQGAVAVAVGFSGAVRTRDEAVRAIDMVCEYLERTEPTNPAQLLLRRARRLINHNFLQLMKELAPDALSEVARVMGVDPESVHFDDAG